MANANWPPRAALITGAGSGLGRQLALLLGREGIAIAGVDCQAAGLETLDRQLRDNGAKAAWEVADVSDAKALTAAVDSLRTRLGPLDLLIACAGIGLETSALNFDPAAIGATIQVNLIGVANSVAAVLPGMLAQRRGQLAAISSLASYRGLPYMAAYCASKSGLNAFMEAVRVEVKPRGITTTIVCPGWVRTPMTAKLHLPMPGIMELEDASGRILRAIRLGKSFDAFPRGLVRHVRLLHWLPAGISDYLIERMLRRLMRGRP